MALVWNKALFDELYTSKPWTTGYRFTGQPRPPFFHYHWYGNQNGVNHRISGLLSQPGFASLTDVAVIGGAFGWLAEALVANGINAFSVDTSDYIVANEDVSEEAELRAALTAQGFDPDDLGARVLFVKEDGSVASESEVWAAWLRADGKRTSIPVEQEDMSTNGSRNKVRQRAQGTLDAVLDEYAMESCEDDTESLQLAERCEQVRPNPACTVVHMISGAGGDPRMNFKSGEDWRTLLDANGFNDHWVVNAAGKTF